MISRLDDDLAFVSLWKSKRTKARLDTARRTLAELWEFFEMPAAYAPRTG